MWKRSDQDFPANRMSKLKSHLATGGTLWLGNKSSEFHDSVLVTMGDGKHGRTSDEGCILSVAPVGEGGNGITAQIRLSKAC